MRYQFDIKPGQTPTSAQHEAMAQHYRNIISQALKEFDNGNNPDSTYESLAWEGLYGTTAWNNSSNTDKTNIINFNSDFKNSNNNCQ